MDHSAQEIGVVEQTIGALVSGRKSHRIYRKP